MNFKQFYGQNMENFRASRIKNPILDKFHYFKTSRADLFRKKRSRENFLRKNAPKNMEEITFSIFLGCGKNKEFWPEYSLLKKELPN